MIFFLSLVTSAKDYFEIVHNLIEFHPNYSIIDYNELGSLISYLVLSIKNFLFEFFTLNWLQNLWSLPILVPDIASAMISEISVLDGFFHNALTFLEMPLSYGKQNYAIYGLEKFTIGLINSFFLFLPTSAAHIIMLRRFVFQGIEAGYIAGLGIIAGNLLWLASIIFGWRFFIIPWLSLDILRYLLGFVILIKYMWHAVHDERRTSVSAYGSGSFGINAQPKIDLAKSKIFLVTFLLALTEQTSLYPFVTNISIGAESTILENFPVDNLTQFIFIHSAYLFGIFAGSYSLLHFTCWLWENPIYKIYIWFISNSFSTINLPFNFLKGTKTNYYKYLNFFFLYLIMLCTISSIPYFGLDYTLTNPLGFISDDRLLYLTNKKTNQPELPETSFLSSQASDRNTRDSRGRHGRRERWKDRLIKYRGMDTSLYDQSIYDLFTIEDLNFGFDKFWLRRKIKNHHSRFRMVIFQPWLLSLKKQLAKPRLIFNDGVRVELFRMLYEQFYHPNFHAYLSTNLNDSKKNITKSNNFINETSHQIVPSIPWRSQNNLESGNLTLLTKLNSQLAEQKNNNLGNKKIENKLTLTTSALRKFVRKINTRVKSAQILLPTNNLTNKLSVGNLLYSKYSPSLINPIFSQVSSATRLKTNINLNQLNNNSKVSIGEKDKKYFLSVAKKKDRQILRYKTLVKTSNTNNNVNSKAFSNLLSPSFNNPKIMLHPIKFYLQKEKALKRKWKAFYGANVFRKLSIENNAPYFRIMMKRLFYYYKPTLRYINTLKLAKNKQGHKIRRKKSRTPLSYAALPSSTNISINQPSSSITIPLGRTAGGDLGANPTMLNSNFAINQDILISPDFAGKSNVPSSSVNLKFPTHNYRVVGKNASRYRFEIYRQALLNWYYTPFNRLLLKFDIDSFIRRQPNSHFLTKKEEQDLHLKRFLLSEHYDTLRWYTFMQHYRSMKTNIGGTKSFASRMYNHQFQGTFKKLRHLFAITPTSFNQPGLLTSSSVRAYSSGFLGESKEKLTGEPLNDKNNLNINSTQILKFDQPLYNEYSNTQLHSIINDSVIHEELKNHYPEGIMNDLNSSKGDDLITQSISIVKDFLKTSQEKRQENIKNLLRKNNYKEFTKFIFTGQKIRGLKATTNQLSLNKQEQEYLNLNKTNNVVKGFFDGYPLPEIKQQNSSNIPNLVWQKNPSYSVGIKEGSSFANSSLKEPFFDKKKEISNMEQNLWFSFLHNYKKGLYDQEFLTKYLERRIKKKERRQQKKEKELKNRLKRLKVWLAPNPSSETKLEAKNSISHPLLTTGIKNAIKDGILNLKEKTLLGSVASTPRISPQYPDTSARVAARSSAKQPLRGIGVSGWRGSFTLLRATPSDSDLGVISNKGGFLVTGKGGDSISPVRSLSLIKLKNEKELKKEKNIFNATKSLVYTTYLKTKIISYFATQKLKNILSLPRLTGKANQILAKKKHGFFNPLIHKDPILTWEIKDKMLKKRKRSRKKYKQKIKQVQTTLIKSIIKQKKDYQIQKTNYQSQIKEIPMTAVGRPTKPAYLTGSLRREGMDQAMPLLKFGEQKNSPFTINPVTVKKNAMRFVPFKSNASFSIFNLKKKLGKQKTNNQSVRKELAILAKAPQNFNETDNDTIQEIKRKKKVSEDEIIKSSQTAPQFDKFNNGQGMKGKKLLVENDFLYVNTLYGKKLEILQNFRRKKTKNRRNQRYGRAQHRVEHPSLNANLERKNANMVPEKRLQTLKEQTELNYALNSFNNDLILSYEKNNTVKNLLNPQKRKSKKRNVKRRFKKGINNEKLRKARNHNRDTIAAQRTNTLTKQIKRIKLNLKLQEWWWKQFLPNITVTAETNWQLEKERQLQKTIAKLSKTEILERDLINSSKMPPELQIGDYDFKPLSIPQAFRIRDNLNSLKQTLRNTEMTTYANVGAGNNPSLNETLLPNKPFLMTTNPLPFYAGWDESLRKLVVTNRLLSRREAGYSINSSYFTPAVGLRLKTISGDKKENNQLDSKIPNFKNEKNDFMPQNKIEFTNSPLQGMNAGTTLYCQVPFTTFDPDQLFPIGLDSFAPIGWRRFDFTHTILKTQSFFQNNITNQTSNPAQATEGRIRKPFVIQKNLFSKLDKKTNQINFKKPFLKDFETIKKYTNYSRRLKKHYKRIKKLQNEKAPVFLISGPLITEVLPIHYINIFNKQNRLSRDRYLKRRLRRGKKGVPRAIKQQNLKNSYNIKINASNNKSDFTLRRRIKTKRKYHRKSSITKGIEIRPRRHKFYTEFKSQIALNNQSLQSTKQGLIGQISKNILRKRPSKRKTKKNRDYDGSLTTKARQRQKIQKTGALNARLRQLRRRVSRQVLKTVPRRRPRAGGFLWPGDYLRLEQTESPKLNLNNKQTLLDLSLQKDMPLGSNTPKNNSNQNTLALNTSSLDDNKQKIKRKIDKKSILLDLFVQPRKYLLEKHNLKVIKKKLEKAQRPL